MKILLCNFVEVKLKERERTYKAKSRTLKRRFNNCIFVAILRNYNFKVSHLIESCCNTSFRCPSDQKRVAFFSRIISLEFRTLKSFIYQKFKHERTVLVSYNLLVFYKFIHSGDFWFKPLYCKERCEVCCVTLSQHKHHKAPDDHHKPC